MCEEVEKRLRKSEGVTERGEGSGGVMVGGLFESEFSWQSVC